LANHFPLTVVARWLGNTPAIAFRHYVSVTDQTYLQAVQEDPFEARDSFGGGSESGAKSGAVMAPKAAPQAPATVGTERKFSTQPLESKGVMPTVASPCFLVNKGQTERTGSEPFDASACHQRTYDNTSTSSGAKLGANLEATIPPGLLEALQGLTPEQRRVLAQVLRES